MPAGENGCAEVARNGQGGPAYLQLNVRPKGQGYTLAQREGGASDEALMDAYARGDAAAFQVLL